MKLATAAMAAFLTATSAFAEVEQKMQVIYCSSDHSDFERMYGPTEVVYGPDRNAFGFAFAVLENDEYKALVYILPDGVMCVGWDSVKVDSDPA